MKDLLKKRAAIIWKAVKIGKVLSDLNYDVDAYDEGNQQFSCDLHGSEDHSPSAHLYYDQNVWHCFGCGKRRDAVQTIIDKKHITFTEALDYLESKYNIKTVKDITELVIPISGSEKDFSSVRKDTEDLLLYLSRNRYFSKEQAIIFWRKYDMLCSADFRKAYAEPIIKNYLVKIKNEALQIIG